MSTRNCYTYLIGWSKENKYYYGVRYAKNCMPSDLWNTYFTSSVFVKQHRKLYGEPDIVQVRQVFGNNSQKAKLWEDKVLKRLNVKNNLKWLNQSNNYSFKGVDSSWNEGLTKETCVSLRIVSEKIKEARKHKKWNTRAGTKNSTDHNVKNSWRQIITKNPKLTFANYCEFSKFCEDRYINGISPCEIASELGLYYTTVTTALERNGIDAKLNQSWTKIKKRYPDFRFATYNDFAAYCQSEILKGRKRWHLKIELGLSEDAIKKALSYSL